MSILLITHIIAMVSSLGLTALLAASSVAAYRINTRIYPVSVAVTGTGTFTGAVLLTQYPLDFKCAVLLGYVAAFTIIYKLALKKHQLLIRSES